MLLHFLQQYVDLPETIVEKLSLDEADDEVMMIQGIQGQDPGLACQLAYL